METGVRRFGVDKNFDLASRLYFVRVGDAEGANGLGRDGNRSGMNVPFELYRMPGGGGQVVQNFVAGEDEGLVRFVAQLVGAIYYVCERVPEARVQFAEMLGPALDPERPT
jgi:hypothetical protein